MSCEENCLPECQEVFRRAWIDHVVLGGSRVYWELLPDFNDPGPYTFTLYAGRTGNPDAEDWVQVGLPAVDAPYLQDDEVRLFGMQEWTHYQIRLVTGSDTYHSLPIPILSQISFTDWRHAREILRKEKLHMRGGAGNEGFLLKRKLYGDVCPDCKDFQTGEPTLKQCQTCYGTGIVGGFHPPIECFYVQFTNKQIRYRIEEQSRGGIAELQTAARIPAEYLLFEEDVWVDAKTDERWFIKDIKSAGDIRAKPVVYDPVILQLADFKHVIYRFPVPKY